MFLFKFLEYYLIPLIYESIVYDVLLQQFMKLRPRHGVYTRTGTNETIKTPHMRQSGTPIQDQSPVVAYSMQ